MKLYDGRGKRFKKLVDPKVIMNEHGLKISDVLPKEARAKRYLIWIKSSSIGYLATNFAIAAVMLSVKLFTDHDVYLGSLLEWQLPLLVIYFFLGGLVAITDWRWTWKSNKVAIQTLAQRGFCSNCGYIIGDTPLDADGCIPCAECGHAWSVEAAET